MSAAGPPQGANRGAADDVVIDVRGINKHFGENHAVKDLALTVRRGEIFGFLGPNGSGKTTSIRMICGLLTPDGGEGTCLGYDVLRETKQIKRHVGYMTQAFSFWVDLTIRENLRFIARMYGMQDGHERVERELEQLGLMDRADQLAGALSGGWKQRLALAACLLHDPHFIDPAIEAQSFVATADAQWLGVGNRPFQRVEAHVQLRGRTVHKNAQPLRLS